MKKLSFLFVLILVISVASTFAQSTPGKSFNRKGYQAWVKLSDSNIVHGLLWNVDSAFVEIKSDQVKKWKSPDSNAPLTKIPLEEIQSIRTKKVHAVLKGYGWGAIIGNSVGGLMAVGFEASEPGNDGYIVLMPMFGLAGSFTGLIAGALPDMTFNIEGKEENFKPILPELGKRAFWQW